MAVNFTADHKRTSEYRFYPEDITIRPDLNGRHEAPDIEWLINDILAHSQHSPVVIRNDGGGAVLVAGFSRWRAISEINKRGLAPVKMQLRCTYVQCTEAESFLINISENRFRNPTLPIDDAHNIKRLLNLYAMTEDQVTEFYFPTARTESELQEARKFIRSRMTLIGLSPEAEVEVRSGRVKETAAVAIAKLSTEQQRAALKKLGTIELRDVQAPKVAKPVAKDHELMRRITAVLEDISGLLHDPDPELEYLQVERKLLLNLHNYVEEIRAR